MPETKTPMFAKEIGDLNGVKRAIMQAAQSSPSPTVHNAARLAVDHLDMTYLLLCNLNNVIAEFSPEKVEAAAEAALAQGKLKVLPDPEG